MVSQSRHGPVGSAVSSPPVSDLLAQRTLPPIGIVAAFSWEVRLLLRKQNGVKRLGPQLYSFRLGEDPALLAIAGMGAENSFRAAWDLFERFAPRALCTLGFAGALVESLVPGDVILAEKVLDQETGRQFDCRDDLLPLPGIRRGNLLSVSGVITSAAEKRRLAQKWGAVAVDMESAGVARAAAEAGVAFCAIKSITDSRDQSISIDFERCRSEHGQLSLFQMAREGLRSPQRIRDLWTLAHGARLAARSLAAALSSAQ